MLYKLGIPKIPSIIACLVTPAVSFYLLESLTHNVRETMGIPLILLNLLFYYLFYGLILVIFRRSWVALSLGTLMTMLIGLANYFVLEFRSVPIYPWDFLSLGTAASVSSNYDYTLEPEAQKLVLGFMILIAIGIWTRWKFKLPNRKAHAAIVLAFVLGIGTYTGLVQTSEVHSAVGFYEYLFTPISFYRKNGFMVSFLSNMQYLEIDAPSGYDAGKVEEILELYVEESESMAAKNADVKPNVIVIMNEAFSDPSVLGTFETNVDYMPFIHSMTENTIQGLAVASVKGGNTANAEYEFLTGNSMAFLPMGSIPYQQYIRGTMPTLASQLKKQGYATYAMHPYGASGWNRNNVYEWFGFDESYFKPSFSNAELIREYVSDLSTYQKIVDLYNDKEDGQPMFVFDVTMQNHSSYSKEYENFIPDVEVYGSENDALLERYLSLIKISDSAFGALVRYFEKQTEPTIILMFGDHQPADWVVQYIYRMHGQYDSAEWSESLERYEVPFVMWSNYDMDEETVLENVDYTSSSKGMISMNYLGTLLMEAAGLPKSAYQLYMDDLVSKYPIAAANGFYDAEGNLYGTTDLDEVPEELKAYWMLNYNSLFDVEERNDAWYE